MSEAKRPTSQAPFDALPVLPVFSKTIEMWLKYQADLISGIHSTMTEWMDRQQEAVTAAQKAIARMSECRDPADFVKIQQEFWSECMQRTATNTNAFGATMYELTRKTAADIEEAGRAALQHAQDAGTELLKAAGSKPAAKVAEKVD